MTKALVILAALGILLSPPAHADEMESRTVTVRGEASVPAAPDRAEVVAGVASQGLTATEALTANSKAMGQLFAVLDAFGIEARDRRTTQFTVGPVFERPEQRGAPPRIVGYSVANEVSITLRQQDRLGALLDRLVRDGANRVHSIQFTIGDIEPLADAARRKAIADARRKAALYAEAAGVEVGEVQRISEISVSIPGPRMVRMAEMQAAAPVPVAPGEQEVRAAVTVVYEIE